MKFITTTPPFLLTLMLCMHAYSTQAAGTVVTRRRNSEIHTRNFKIHNRNFKKGNLRKTLHKKKEQKPKQKGVSQKAKIAIIGIGGTVIGSFILFGAYKALSDKEEPEPVIEEKYKSLVWEESIWEVNQSSGDVDKNNSDKVKKHNAEEINDFICHYLKGKAKQNTSPRNTSSSYPFDAFVSEIYCDDEDPTERLSGLTEKDARDGFKILLRVVINTLMDDCTLLGIDKTKINNKDEDEIKKRDNIITKELEKLLKSFQDCHSLGYQRLMNIVSKYKLKATLKDELRVIIDKTKRTILEELIFTYNPNVVKKGASRGNAPQQLFHLTNTHIANFGKNIGINPKATVGDRNAGEKHYYLIKFRDPVTSKELTVDQFKEIFKETMRKQIDRIANEIMQAINGSILSEKKGTLRDISSVNM